MFAAATRTIQIRQFNLVVQRDETETEYVNWLNRNLQLFVNLTSSSFASMSRQAKSSKKL